MTKVQAVAELRRMYPEASQVSAWERVSLPNEPGWRCQVSAWAWVEAANVWHYGRGETFEGALADMVRREVSPTRVVRVAA